MTKTPPKGIRLVRKTGRWQARVSYTPHPGNHIEIVLGTFDTIEEAIRARQLAETLLEEGRIEEYVKPKRQLTERQASIVTGTLLGDGSLQKPTKKNHNSFLTVKQTKSRREYLEWMYEEFGHLSQGICRGTGRSPNYPERETENVRFYTRRLPVFTALRNKWYPKPVETKIVPKDIELDPLAIAIWFADDGTNRNKNGRFTFCTNSFTPADCEILIAQFEKFGIKAWRDNSEGRLHLSRSHRLIFHDLIAPYFQWKCFDYKLHLQNRNAPHPEKSLRLV